MRIGKAKEVGMQRSLLLLAVCVLMLPAAGIAAEPVAITFDDLSLGLKPQIDVEFDRAKLTPKIKALEGKLVRIRGYIMPAIFEERLTKFVLDAGMRMKFGPIPYDEPILVELPAGQTFRFTTRPIVVTGVLTIQPLKNGLNETAAIYHIAAQKVEIVERP